MSKQANKTVIGGFVVGAVVLVVAGVLVFGSGRFLTKTETYVMYFQGSVKGLDVGAPVVFQGVKIGSVTDIVLRVHAKDLSFSIPVFIKVEDHRFQQVGRRAGELSPREITELLVERGMRAQLQMQSLITGKLMVEIDFHPDTPVKLVGTDTEYPEVPTIPSDIQQFLKKIEEIPIKKIYDKVLSAVDGIDEFINSSEMQDCIHSLNLAVNDFRKLVQNVDTRVGPLVSSIEDTATDVQKLMRNVDDQIPPLASSIKNTVETASDVLSQAQTTLRAIQGSIGQDSPLVYQLNNALKELSAAARSIRVLVAYLDQNPDALIRGKRRPGGEK
ncbi:MAG: hypothetical protein BA861_12525 [Desulfobacterales bacterium S3730MH5]|nr:MAG: hypothetical protein BA861_12525 [Desulfobacterales bacterium S3730MH5]